MDPQQAQAFHQSIENSEHLGIAYAVEASEPETTINWSEEFVRIPSSTLGKLMHSKEHGQINRNCCFSYCNQKTNFRLQSSRASRTP